MATNKKGLHAPKHRSNSSPELQLPFHIITDSVTNEAHAPITTVEKSKDNDNPGSLPCHSSDSSCEGSTNADGHDTVVRVASLTTLSDTSTSSSTEPADQHTCSPCSSCGNITGAAASSVVAQSVRPKVRNAYFKTKNEPSKHALWVRRNSQECTDRITMDLSSSDHHNMLSKTNEKSTKQQKQGFSRVAGTLVARFRQRGLDKQPQSKSLVTDPDSLPSRAKDFPVGNVLRPRSKSLSGRIMRKFGAKEKKESSCKDMTKRKGYFMSSSQIQSRIGGVFAGKQKSRSSKREQDSHVTHRHAQVINMAEFNPDDYPTECEDDIQRVLREQEIREGVDPPPGYQPRFNTETEEPATCIPMTDSDCIGTEVEPLPVAPAAAASSTAAQSVTAEVPTHTTANKYDQYGSLSPEGTYIPRTVHTQIDYMHCLVPDQKSILGSSFYWGKIDRFEADLLLENKPEGTFLLRDSAHDEFVFSVSFRRYGRTLHARVEQWKHKFSFDAHDPGVYSARTICKLLKHYTDPNFCMFFEPMLTIPLPRPNPPSLQELARATICSNTTYDGISNLALPRSLKEYSREYHYKQRVRMRRFEVLDIPVAEPKPGVITKICISR